MEELFDPFKKYPRLPQVEYDAINGQMLGSLYIRQHKKCSTLAVGSAEWKVAIAHARSIMDYIIGVAFQLEEWPERQRAFGSGVIDGARNAPSI